MNTRHFLKIAKRACLAAFAAALLIPATPARAAVSLSLSDNDSTPASVSVVRGSSFTVTAYVTSTSEKVTGVDYYLQTAGSAVGTLRLTGRDTSASQLSDLIRNNTGDNGSNAGVLDTSVSLLNPKNTLDLGASIANVSNALNAGTYALATYTILVDPSTAAGTYTLSTTSLAGTGWVGAAPLFTESSFGSQGTFTVTVTTGVGGGVVPEPTGAAVLLTGMIPLVLRRRR
jgi:hypothetical protein